MNHIAKYLSEKGVTCSHVGPCRCVVVTIDESPLAQERFLNGPGIVINGEWKQDGGPWDFTGRLITTKEVEDWTRRTA